MRMRCDALTRAGSPLEVVATGVNGEVTMEAVVSLAGCISEGVLIQGVYDPFDFIAAWTASGFRFRPATVNGTPVAMRARVIIECALERTLRLRISCRDRSVASRLAPDHLRGARHRPAAEPGAMFRPPRGSSCSPAPS